MTDHMRTEQQTGERATADRERDQARSRAGADAPDRQRAEQARGADPAPKRAADADPRFTLDRLIPVRKSFSASPDVVNGVTASALAAAYKKAGDPSQGMTRAEVQAALDDYYAHEPADEPTRKAKDGDAK